MIYTPDIQRELLDRIRLSGLAFGPTYTTAINNVIDFDTNDFEYLQALVVEEYMAEFLEDLAEDEANLA